MRFVSSTLWSKEIWAVSRQDPQNLQDFPEWPVLSILQSCQRKLLDLQCFRDDLGLFFLVDAVGAGGWTG